MSSTYFLIFNNTQKEALKAKSQIAVKTATSPTPAPQQVIHSVAPGAMVHDPDIAQAQAQIMAHHEALRSTLQNQVSGGK